MSINRLTKIVQFLASLIYLSTVKLVIVGTVLLIISAVPIINADQYAPWWNNPRYYRPGLFPTVETGARFSDSCWSSWQRDRFNGLVEVRVCN